MSRPSTCSARKHPEAPGGARRFFLGEGTSTGCRSHQNGDLTGDTINFAILCVNPGKTGENGYPKMAILGKTGKNGYPKMAIFGKTGKNEYILRIFFGSKLQLSGKLVVEQIGCTLLNQLAVMAMEMICRTLLIK